MIKYYKHNESDKKIRVIQYDGTVKSIQQMVEILGQNITVTKSAVYICAKHITMNDYCVIYSSSNISIYSAEIFKEVYTEYIPDRKFKCNRQILIYLWKEVHRTPDIYTVSVVNGIITITCNVSGNKVRISDILTITKSNLGYPSSLIEQTIISMCDEVRED